MALIALIFVALSLDATVDATKLVFINIGGRIIVETDSQNYGLYGQIKDKQGELIPTVVNGMNAYHMTAKCERLEENLENNQDHLVRLGGARENYIKAVNAELQTATSYSWSDTFSSADLKLFSVSKPGGSTLVFSSGYFPENLARVIIHGDLNIFIYYSGRIVLKLTKCLFDNERTLINGIKKIKTNKSSSDDKALRKHLLSHPIDEQDFHDEQNYIRPFTTQELIERAAKNRKITLAIRGEGYGVFDGKW